MMIHEKRAIVEPCIRYEFKDDLVFLQRKMTKRLRQFKGCKKVKVRIMWSINWIEQSEKKK